MAKKINVKSKSIFPAAQREHIPQSEIPAQSDCVSAEARISNSRNQNHPRVFVAGEVGSAKNTVHQNQVTASHEVRAGKTVFS